MSRNNSSVGFRKHLIYCLMLAAGCLLLSCSQPVLESQECIASRDIVKKFYSFHLGNDMTPNTKNLEKRKKYLTSKLQKELAEKQNTKFDYFTQTKNYPRAFRAGACKKISDDMTRFEVLFFRRPDEGKSETRFTVETKLVNGEWRINKVSSTELR